ncbi:MAG: hypothetical protein WC184_08180 [Acidimicrobiia bacterium]
MERLILAVVLVGVAGVIAALIQRREPDAPTAPPTTYRVPTQVDRADFVRSESPWLVAVFTSATCNSCVGAIEKARALECSEVAVQEIEVGAQPKLHQRYEVEGVPLTLLIDHEGVVNASFAGGPIAEELWATLGKLREGESGESSCSGDCAACAGFGGVSETAASFGGETSNEASPTD